MIVALTVIAAAAAYGTRIRPRWAVIAVLAVAAIITGGWTLAAAYPIMVGVIGTARHHLSRRDALTVLAVFATTGPVAAPATMLTLIYAGIASVVLLRGHLTVVTGRIRETMWGAAGALAGTPTPFSAPVSTKALPLWPFAVAAVLTAGAVPLPSLVASVANGGLTWTTLPFV